MAANVTRGKLPIFHMASVPKARLLSKIEALSANPSSIDAQAMYHLYDQISYEKEVDVETMEAFGELFALVSSDFSKAQQFHLVAEWVKGLARLRNGTGLKELPWEKAHYLCQRKMVVPQLFALFSGNTLREAVLVGNVDLVRALIVQKPELINEPSGVFPDLTPLQVALIQHGRSSLNKTFGEAFLNTDSRATMQKIVSSLLEAGADPGKGAFVEFEEEPQGINKEELPFEGLKYHPLFELIFSEVTPLSFLPLYFTKCKGDPIPKSLALQSAILSALMTNTGGIIWKNLHELVSRKHKLCQIGILLLERGIQVSAHVAALARSKFEKETPSNDENEYYFYYSLMNRYFETHPNAEGIQSPPRYYRDIPDFRNAFLDWGLDPSSRRIDPFTGVPFMEALLFADKGSPDLYECLVPILQRAKEGKNKKWSNKENPLLWEVKKGRGLNVFSGSVWSFLPISVRDRLIEDGWTSE